MELELALLHGYLSGGFLFSKPTLATIKPYVAFNFVIGICIPYMCFEARILVCQNDLTFGGLPSIREFLIFSRNAAVHSSDRLRYCLRLSHSG